MSKIIKDHQIVDDTWLWIKDPEQINDEILQDTKGQYIFPLAIWLENQDILSQHTNKGLWLDSHQGPENINVDLEKLDVIAIHFPAFGDGRGYSYARLLRERYGYQGEIRAVGDVLKDQLFNLMRCGFNAFAVREDRDIEVALSGLKDFSEVYQSSVEQPDPLFRRHQ